MEQDWRNPWLFGGQNQCFTYDAQNWLVGAWTHMAPSTCANTSASDSDGTNVAAPGTTYRHTYGYNAQGNIVSRQSLWGGSSTWTYNYGAGNAGPHAVSSITVSGVGAGTHTFGYDAAGNMTSRSIVGQGTQSMGYDVFGQMTSLSQGGVTTQYLYDAFGRRVREAGPAGHTVFVDRWAEHDGSFHTQHFFIGDARFGFRYNNSLTYVVSDHLGSVIASNFTFFNDAHFRRYLPFGDVRGSATDVPTLYGYTGQRRDTSGLMWYRSRYYDPLVGRFTQADTIVPDAATPAAFNRYSYVINNPLKYVDPTGHCYGLPDGESVDRCVAGFQAARESVVDIYMGGGGGLSGRPVQPDNSERPQPVDSYMHAVGYAHWGTSSQYVLGILAAYGLHLRENWTYYGAAAGCTVTSLGVCAAISSSGWLVRTESRDGLNPTGWGSETAVDGAVTGGFLFFGATTSGLLNGPRSIQKAFAVEKPLGGRTTAIWSISEGPKQRPITYAEAQRGAAAGFSALSTALSAVVNAGCGTSPGGCG